MYISCMYIWNTFCEFIIRVYIIIHCSPVFWFVGAERARFHVVMITLVKSSRVFVVDVRCRVDKSVRGLVESFLFSLSG